MINNRLFFVRSNIVRTTHLTKSISYLSLGISYTFYNLDFQVAFEKVPRNWIHQFFFLRGKIKLFSRTFLQIWLSDTCSETLLIFRNHATYQYSSQNLPWEGGLGMCNISSKYPKEHTNLTFSVDLSNLFSLRNSL